MTIVRLVFESAFDYLNFDQADLDALLDMRDSKGGYWERAHEFVASLKDLDRKGLTVGQVKWASDIHDELDKMRRKGRI